jgi:ribosomal-protein-alanine N-acetyltransferase
MLLNETRELVGTLDLYGIDHENARAIVRVDLMKKHWGKGLMSEALRALVDCGFREMGLNRIEAAADLKNLRSIRLMDLCRFWMGGVLRQRSYYEGAFHDDVMYFLLKEEWAEELSQ